MNIRKIPTAVAAFDSIIKGGVPEGSVVLLFGEPGAGMIEFSITSASKLSLIKKRPEFMREIIGGYTENIYIPSKTLYISFTKSEEEIKRFVTLSIEEDLSNSFFDNLVVKDLSSIYFRRSFIPKSWISQKSILVQSNEDLFQEVVKFLNDYGDDSIIIIDSLTDLFTNPSINEQAIIDIIKGLVKVSKKWSSLIYLILNEKIASERMEQIIFDAVDGILFFKWYSSEKYSQRYRYLYVLKFIGVLPHIEEERVIRFKTQVDFKNGFVVTYTEKIR